MAALLAPGAPQGPLSKAHSHPPPPAASSISGDDTQKSDPSEPALNVSVFKELAKRALVDTLNSVGSFVPLHLLACGVFMLGGHLQIPSVR